MATITPGARALALKLISGFEGLRLQAYQDAGGVWTIGYGCTGAGIGPGTVWTQEHADAALARRVDAFMAAMAPHLKVQPTDNQWAAMTSLCYNVGALNFIGSTLLRHFNAGDPAAAADFLAWDHVHGQVNAGLLRRRQEESTLFRRVDSPPAA